MISRFFSTIILSISNHIGQGMFSPKKYSVYIATFNCEHCTQKIDNVTFDIDKKPATWNGPHAYNNTVNELPHAAVVRF